MQRSAFFSLSCLSNPLIVVMKRGAKPGFSCEILWSDQMTDVTWSTTFVGQRRALDRQLVVLYLPLQTDCEVWILRMTECVGARNDEHTQPPWRNVVAPIWGESHVAAVVVRVKLQVHSLRTNNNNNTNRNHTHKHTPQLYQVTPKKRKW